MAEELLGVGFDIHGGGNDLLFPHHENEAAQTRPRAGAPLARIWMHNGMLQLGDEKMAKSVGNIRGLGDVLDEVGPRRADHVLLRRPLPPADRLLARARSTRRPRARRAHPRGRAPARAAATRRRTWRRCATRSSTRWPTTSTRRARWRALFDWVREANRRDGPVGDATCARCSACSGSTNLLDADRRAAPPELRRAWPSGARSGARRRATSPRPTAARRAARARLGGRGDGARRAASSAARRGRTPP